MSEERKFPAVHIDRRHQSAPKESDADKAVRLAAEEIDGGRWKLSEKQTAEMNEVPGIALRAGTADAVDPRKNPYTQADFDRTDESLVLGEHPRVIEALAKLEQQKEKAAHGQEYAEVAAMMHETIECSRRRQRWDGQERWQDDDVLEQRMGRVLSPLQFYKQLIEEGLEQPARLGNVHDYPVRQMEWEDTVERVRGVDVPGRALKDQHLWVRTVGAGRLLLARDVKKMHREDKSGRVALLVMAQTDQPAILPGQKTHSEEPVQVATLQWPFGTEWMVMKFDEFGVPRTPRFIGWRTALLALIRNGAITIEEAHRAFPLGAGPQASWYRQQLFEFTGRR